MDIFSFLQPQQQKNELISLASSIPSNYVGGKRRILASIWDILHDNNIEFNSVFDAFSGSSMVSLLFKLMGKTVICNDLLTSSTLTAFCLLHNHEEFPVDDEEIKYLLYNKPSNHTDFVLNNYCNKFFTEKECIFLDSYKENIIQLYGTQYYSGQNSSGNPKWNYFANTQSFNEKREYFKASLALFAMLNHINQNCFLGGRYYNGQTIAKMKHRINHAKNNGKEITDIPLKMGKFQPIIERIQKEKDNCQVNKIFNCDVIELLEKQTICADLIYLDPPYGGASSDYAMLYGFLEEYLYEDKLKNLDHIIKGSKRFSSNKGYQEQLEHLLGLCNNFKTWMISYNESSYADLETIINTIKSAGRDNVIVKSIPIAYQYRKNKNVVDEEQFVLNYYEEGYKFKERGTEYLILAQK